MGEPGPRHLLDDPTGLVAHHQAMLARDGGPGGAVEICSIAWLSATASARLRPLIRRPRFARAVTLAGVVSTSLDRRDSEPVAAVTTDVGAWQVIVDPWMNWPLNNVTADETAGGGEAVVVDWRTTSVISRFADGQVVFSADLADGPDRPPLGTDLSGYRAALAGLPWDGTVDPRAVALAVAARLTGEVLPDGFFADRFRPVTLRHRPIDTSDLLRDFHDHAPAHDPGLLAIVADTACTPASVRQIAVESAVFAVRRAGLDHHAPLAEALAVLTSGAAPQGDPVWQQRVLDLIEPKAAVVREHMGRPDLQTPVGWRQLTVEVDAYESVAAAFGPEPYRAAVRAWMGISSPDFHLPDTKVYADDYVRWEILSRCIHRARDSGRHPLG